MSNRFVRKWTRVYYQGLDISGYTRSWGTAGTEFALVGESDPMLDEAVKGVMLGQSIPEIGPISSIMNNVSGGMHNSFSGQSNGVITLAIGFDGVPAIGDPTFSCEVEQLGYKGDVGEDVPITLTLKPTVDASTLLYDYNWGVLLHDNSAETAATTADAADDDYGASSSFGGYMVYHLLSSDGTCTLKVQDADTETNASYSDLLSSGEIDASASPVSGLVALAKGSTVERYTRWQIALNSATTATFVISFHRAVR